ncbi:non-homologous end-joining DNA ligase [Roseibium salinum]|uniref:DNA ligase (ATP) n=1 Tax=Roseibium salinum TaxID=1604349 RepID=A0ABT3R3X4_9HYPH|nr:non-homologous end-joining DNA ligase [Roseibium sp. DSM 29163]MCX2723966.1 non-homologous end-joining DNA ligase [Roseibium sp. DSM 29163]
MGVSVDRLAEYVAKRDFSRTAEPQGSAADKPSDKPLFVVQKHAATRLHYDFRLEWEGVLLSWAVTRGPSADPSVKRLAVRTEDHPLDYGDFEGTIPKDQYGGGTVMLWDQGWWEPQEDFRKGLRKGRLKVRLYGERMKGGWALVRMRAKEGEKRENWLLIKEHDAFEESGEDTLTARYLTSVATAREMEEIADGRKPKSRNKKTQRTKEESRSFSLSRPRFRKLQTPKPAEKAPEGDDWLHETKLDGYRCLAALGKGGALLYSGTGRNWTGRFEGLPEAFAALECENALIDGEVVSAKPGKRAPLSALQRDVDEGRPVLFIAFDLLELNGEQLVDKPLLERKTLLEQLLAGGPEGSPVHYCVHVRGNGAKAFEAVRKAGGAGIVSKAADSRYSGTQNDDWLKIMAQRRQAFVVGGWTPSKAKGRPFASLLIGSREDGSLCYRGRVGGGFAGDDLERLWKKLKTRGRKTSPFDEVPPDVADTANWVTPDVVVDVGYAELTDENSIRRGVFEGLREDLA